MRADAARLNVRRLSKDRFPFQPYRTVTYQRKLLNSKIIGPKVIKSQIFKDNRGFLRETYKNKFFKDQRTVSHFLSELVINLECLVVSAHVLQNGCDWWLWLYRLKFCS